MLPEERACYIDLLIYQHQIGVIPLDLKRVLMYCSGISEAMLIATLEAKFIKGENGWYNDKLDEVINSRKSFSNKQSINGTVGQFWKKVKAMLTTEEYDKIKFFYSKKSNEIIHKEILEKDLKNDVNIEAMLKAMLKQLENEIENEIIIPNNNNFLFKDTLEKNKIWIKSISTQFKITDDEVVLKLNNFYTHLISEFKVHPSMNEFTKHFKNWIPVNKVKNEPNSNSKPNSNSGYKPASVDREKLLRELAQDAATGNIPGDYSQVRTRSQA
jgi:hypothetical protein